MKASHTSQTQSNKYSKSYTFKTDPISGPTSLASTIQKSLEIQIVQLKKIAHLSFLQVMQTETLHRQEIKNLQKMLTETSQKHLTKQKQYLKKIQALEAELNKFRCCTQSQHQLFNFSCQDLIIEAKNQCSRDISADLSQFLASLNKNYPQQSRELEPDIFDEICRYMPINEAKIVTQNLLEILDFHISTSTNNIKNLNISRKYSELKGKLDNLQLKYQFSMKQLKNLQNHIKNLDVSRKNIQSKNEELRAKIRVYQSDARSRTTNEKSLYSQKSVSQFKGNMVDQLDQLDQQQNQKNIGVKNNSQLKFLRLKSRSYNSSHPNLRFIRSKAVLEMKTLN